jgi:hypothetical protein
MKQRGPLCSRDLLEPFLMLGIGLVLHPYATGREMPGDFGDARLNLSLLEYFYRTLFAALHGERADFVKACHRRSSAR